MAKQLSLEHCVGLPKEDVLQKKYNLWFGMSDTPWFHNVENLRAQIAWVLEHTCERLLIWIPPTMYAINYQHLEKQHQARALREAYELENTYREMITSILTSISVEKSKKITVADYDDLLTPEALHRRKILYKAFSEEGEFYNRIAEIGTDFLEARGRTVTKERLEALALFQLNELPFFVAPLSTIHQPNEEYQAVVYPGYGKLDTLARELIDGTTFPELTRQLNLTKPCGTLGLAYKDQPAE